MILTRRQAQAKNFEGRRMVVLNTDLVKDKYHGRTFYGIAGTYDPKDDTVLVTDRAGQHVSWQSRAIKVIMPRRGLAV